MSESKQILRQEARRHRTLAEISVRDYERAADHFFQDIKPQPGQVIAAYWPVGREFDPRPTLDRLLSEGFTCALPVMQKDSCVLRFAGWVDGQPLAKGDFNVMQPVTGPQTVWLDPDIVIVPLLAFDRRGYRLGQGKGYYDATLSALRAKKQILAVGMAYAEQACLFNLPIEEHDQRLDWVITPKVSHYFEPL